MTLFVLLVGGAVALGGISEGQGWAVPAWLAVTFAIPLLYLVGLHWFAGPWPWLMPLLALHGMALAFGIGRQPATAGA